MRSFFLRLGLFMLVSCGPEFHGPNFGEVKVSELLEVKGKPIAEHPLPGANERGILVYPEDEKFQYQGEVITHSFRRPKPAENSVIFWRHRFKDCATSERKLAAPEGAHTPLEIELACPEQGVSVIFTDRSEFISRIIEYAKK